MYTLLWWIVVDVLMAVVARMLIPRQQPQRLILSIAVGLVGSVIGGTLPV